MFIYERTITDSMSLYAYDERTRKKVEEFIKTRQEVITSEIVRLGTKRRVINWQTLKLIMEDMVNDGQVERRNIGSKVIVYRWRA